MPTYWLRDRHGVEHMLHATRAISDETRLILENAVDGQWRPVLDVAAEDVATLMRRIISASGCRWVRARIEPVTSRDTPSSP